ncbi:BTAD domain-containing putative transcriptional regulator [Amycolatopsis sp. NPDC023774]|uniref:AfsR/SARP family transcriptional regulator n=1 Tax=Amycolatopsis sp. NPDC023774 TaxID=3155015 RepID=UPI003406EB41
MLHEVSLHLTGAFELCLYGRAVAVPHAVERLLAYLALTGRPIARSRVAGTLWRDSEEIRAAKCLRTALWRLQRVDAGIVTTADDRVGLGADVPVDVSELLGLAQSLVRDPVDPDAFAGLPRLLDRRDLLPDWDEDWVVLDRERYRLLRLEALESAATEMLAQHRLPDALLVASAAVQSEPLRDSARRLIVRIQLEQGNLVEALRSYQQYRALLGSEFGLEPSAAMQNLVAVLRA